MNLDRIAGMCSLLVAGSMLAGAVIGDEPHGQFTGNIKPIIYVSDVENSAPFYRDVFGFALEGFTGDEADPYYAEMLAGPTKFGLHEPTMAGDESRVGQQRLYFRVHDLEAQRRFVEANGIKVQEIYRRDWMDYFVAQDLDGNLIVFAETDSDRHTSEPWGNESL